MYFLLPTVSTLGITISSSDCFVRMKIPFYTIDAFTSEPFSGNPAAVCPLEADISDDLKQSIATEMNISETCYITKERVTRSVM